MHLPDDGDEGQASGMLFRSRAGVMGTLVVLL